MKLIASLAVSLLLAATLLAQWPEFKKASAPRTADGRVNLAGPAPRTADGKPDFSGVWDKGLLPSEVPPASASNALVRPSGEAICFWQALMNHVAEEITLTPAAMARSDSPRRRL